MEHIQCQRLSITVLASHTRTRKASLNAVASLIDFGSRFIVSFVVNPILLDTLGTHQFGLWQVLGRLIGYAQAADGRPTQALKWKISNVQLTMSDLEKRRQVGSSLTIWILFLPFMVSVGGLLAWFGPNFLDVHTDLQSVVRIVAALLVLDLILRGLGDVPQAVLTGENLGYKRMGLSAVLVFVGGALTLLALHLGAGLVGVVVASLITTCLTGILFLLVTRVNVPWFGVARPTAKSFWSFGRLSGWFLTWNMVMRLLRTSDIVLLGIFASVDIVTVYTLNKYLPEIVINLVAIIALSVAPGLGGIMGSGQLAQASRLRSELMAFTWLILIISGTTILMWNNAFVSLWVGVEFTTSNTSTVLIVLMVMQFALIRTDAHIIDLTLNLRHKVYFGALSVALSIAISIVLVSIFNLGITGLCVGFIAGRSVMSIGYPWLIGKYMGVSLYSQMRASSRPAFVTVLLLGAGMQLEQVWVAESWLHLVLFTGATITTVSVIAFFTGLTKSQQIFIKYRIIKLMNIKTDNSVNQPKEGS